MSHLQCRYRMTTVSNEQKLRFPELMAPATPNRLNPRLQVLSQHISENLTRVYTIPIHCCTRIHVWTLLRAKKTPLTGFRPPSELPAPATENSPTNLSPPLKNPAAAPVEDVVKGMLVEESVEREPEEVCKQG